MDELTVYEQDINLCSFNFSSTKLLLSIDKSNKNKKKLEDILIKEYEIFPEVGICAVGIMF